MSPKATIVCLSCDWQAGGDLPDYEPAGWRYIIEQGEVYNAVKTHHEATNPPGPERGHGQFDVFLEDGRRGVIEGFSYMSIYIENKRGKER